MFKVLKKSNKSKARLTRLKTGHGEIMGPFFMPDATLGFVRGLNSADLADIGLPGLVINTLHLFSRPGLLAVKKFGGMHQFMDFSGPLLSDSGGFQVYSLLHRNKQGTIKKDGAYFNSPFDGKKVKLTPEKSIQIQFDLGADMMVVLDDCPPNNTSRQEILRSIERTVTWARKSKDEFDRQVKKRKLTGNEKPLLFAVIQGGTYVKLRQQCAEELKKIGFDGYGYGARPVDTKGKFLDKVLDATAMAIPENLPRFGLGIGPPEDIVASVRLGWDMFDCVIPTREARHGRLYIWKDHVSLRGGMTKQSRDRHATLAMTSGKKFYETIIITNAKFARDTSPINDSNLRNYSKSYLNHLFKVREYLGARLATLNNLQFYMELMATIRLAIKSGKL